LIFGSRLDREETWNFDVLIWKYSKPRSSRTLEDGARKQNIHTSLVVF
jgi:hypothetical protein